MRLHPMFLVFLTATLLWSGPPDAAWAQTTSAKKTAPAENDPSKPATRVAGSYGNWTLLCGKEGDPKTAEERCSLVLPLIEKKTQKLIFRVIMVYGPKGRLVLRVDGPTGVALQRGVQFATDSGKVYTLPYQTCLPMGCKALLLVQDDMRKELITSKQGSIAVFALNGRAIKTVAAIDGFADGMEALDKRLGKRVSKNTKANKPKKNTKRKN